MAPLFKIAALLNLSLYVAAQGTQFITGPCTSDADCGSGCCGFNTGKCAGAVVALERDGGCGFGDAEPNDNAAQALRGGAPAAPAAPAAEVEQAPATGGGAPGIQNSPGTQFITGECSADTDCASGCCGFNSGKCAAPLVAQERDGGCGFGGAAQGGNTGNGNVANDNDNTNAAPVAAGTQFITGPCTSDADCAAGCCGFNTGKCAGPVIAQERDGGCGFGDAQPNDNAAQALQGRRLGRRGASYM